ncbi:hypothetical protein BOO69_08290 [Sulfitobacter alexandrii]|uniref:Gene transfer agent family protein n=1 Tax=Sulfitobacter alexandrii TaxID=1917485 RepID=A0A1J0WGH2_9RHOB|nr:gene transfer agent family protein [Sulfitobacter alexandrii]APE43415.1 hypothetical protein BOO69_08290 [Sulfitobacter alexandrii]
MAEVIADWAGAERLFRLDLGGVLDLEEACHRDAIGSIFLRISTGQFKAMDVHHVLRLALIGGGMAKVEAKQLLDDRFDTIPYLESATLAGEILIALMSGVEEGEADDATGDPAPWKFSELSQICRVFNMSPADLRAMSYPDFLNMLKGYNATTAQKAAPPTEEEFEEILAKYEPEALRQ